MPPLSFYAGRKALKEIRVNGITPNMFTAFLGASGGPKWFVLAGLDKVIFNDFMHKSDRHIDIIGSSAGAFRAACFAQQNPKAAIERLAQGYSHMVYSEKPSIDEITNKGLVLLDEMMGDKGQGEALASVNKSLHIVVARCHGLAASEGKYKQLAGLVLAAGRNALNRKNLAKSFTRVIFSSASEAFQFTEETPIPTETAHLSQENFIDALMASGSIPAIIKGVENIQGIKNGMFRDGGIIDYHFDMQIQTAGLVLYPHFYATPTGGWFDKSLKSRNCHDKSYDNVLLVCPSDDFVSQLPYGKIPDRKDFEELPAQERIKYWTKVIEESDRLGEYFLNCVENKDPSSFVKPINLIRG